MSFELTHDEHAILLAALMLLINQAAARDEQDTLATAIPLQTRLMGWKK